MLKRQPLYYIIFSLILALAGIGCSSPAPSPAESVDKACVMFENGNYKKAEAIVDSLVNDSLRFNELNVGSLCRLAQLCIRLDSVEGDISAHVADEGDALAARCLGRARDLNTDSVETFLKSLPREQAVRLYIINRVSTYLAIPRDSLVVEGDTVQ